MNICQNILFIHLSLFSCAGDSRDELFGGPHDLDLDCSTKNCAGGYKWCYESLWPDIENGMICDMCKVNYLAFNNSC